MVRYDAEVPGKLEEAHGVALGCWVDVVQDQVQQDAGPQIGLGLG